MLVFKAENLGSIPSCTYTLISAEKLDGLESAVEDGKTPVWFYWDEFGRHYMREGKSIHTVLNVRDALRFVILNLNILTVEDCNNHHILREALYEMKERRGWKPATLNSYVKNINTYMKWLTDMDYIEESNMKKIRKCKDILNEQLTLNEEQIGTLRTCLMNRRQTRLERWRNLLFVDLMILTGARPCELVRMKVKDIRKKGDGYEVLIQGAKQKGRLKAYPLLAGLRDTFEMYMNIRRDIGREEEHLFISQSNRDGFKYKGVNKLFQRLSGELGFHVTAYAIRRFVATRLFLKGIPLIEIQHHLGHTRSTTTLKYIEHTSRLTARGAEVMGEVLG